MISADILTVDNLSLIQPLMIWNFCILPGHAKTGNILCKEVIICIYMSILMETGEPVAITSTPMKSRKL